RSASQEPTPQETPPQETARKTESQLKRRGLIGAVAALAAGVLAKTTTQTAQAQGTPLLMGVGNNSTASTALTQTAGAGPALNVNAATFGIGIAGNSTTTSGVFGSSTNGFGVQASSTNNSGISASSASFHGIVGTTAGDASKVGVLGTATAGPGVNGASG